MRLLAGAAVTGTDKDTGVADWSQVTAGPWLAETLKALRAPDGADADPGPALKGTLRPYQKAGVHWMHLLSGLGLGACLADDMGLGKTIQVLSLLLVQAAEQHGTTAKPAGGAGVAARQLGGGNRAVHARPDGEDRAPVGDDGGSAQASHAG